MYIGKRIQQIREEKEMSLTELAEKSGVQIATLSRIENLKMLGTVESHAQIAKALGIDISHLYSGVNVSKAELTSKSIPSVPEVYHPNETSFYQILTTNVLTKRMLPMLLKIEPKGQTQKEQAAAGSEKFIFVVEGKVEVQVAQEKFSLNKNNSLYFNAALEHSFVNTSAGIAKILIIATPVIL